jgi:O-antigen/teichoic acid export membrane protein
MRTMPAVDTPEPAGPDLGLSGTMAPDVRGEKTVVADYSLVTAAGLLSALLSFGSAALITRLLAPAAFGTLSIVLITSLILQTATSAWTSLAVARFGREALELTGSMAAVTRARLRLVGPWFLAAALLITGLEAIGMLPRQITWPLAGVAILHGSVAIAFEHCTNLLRSLGRQKLGSLATLLQQLVLVVVVAVLLIGSAHAQALQIALLYAAGSTVLLALYLPLLWRVGLRPGPRDRELERRMRRFSTPLIGFTISSYVIGSVDLWILSAYSPPSVFGGYAAVYRAFTTLMTVVAAASPVLMTLFVSLRLAGRDQDIRDFAQRGVPTMVIAGGALVALLIAPAFLLVRVVFGSAFAGASVPFAILVVGLVGYLHCCLLGAVLSAHDRTTDTTRAITVAAVVNVVGDFVAIGLLGAGPSAAAVATVAASLLMAFGYVRAAARCTGATAQWALPGYLAPTLTVIVLVVAPAHLRVPASLATAFVCAPLSIWLAARQGSFHPDLIGAQVALRRRRHADAAARAASAR